MDFEVDEHDGNLNLEFIQRHEQAFLPMNLLKIGQSEEKKKNYESANELISDVNLGGYGMCMI